MFKLYSHTKIYNVSATQVVSILIFNSIISDPEIPPPELAKHAEKKEEQKRLIKIERPPELYGQAKPNQVSEFLLETWDDIVRDLQAHAENNKIQDLESISQPIRDNQNHDFVMRKSSNINFGCLYDKLEDLLKLWELIDYSQIDQYWGDLHFLKSRMDFIMLLIVLLQHQPTVKPEKLIKLIKSMIKKESKDIIQSPKELASSTPSKPESHLFLSDFTGSCLKCASKFLKEEQSLEANQKWMYALQLACFSNTKPPRSSEASELLIEVARWNHSLQPADNEKEKVYLEEWSEETRKRIHDKIFEWMINPDLYHLDESSTYCLVLVVHYNWIEVFSHLPELVSGIYDYPKLLSILENDPEWSIFDSEEEQKVDLDENYRMLVKLGHLQHLYEFFQNPSSPSSLGSILIKSSDYRRNFKLSKMILNKQSSILNFWEGTIKLENWEFTDSQAWELYSSSTQAAEVNFEGWALNMIKNKSKFSSANLW